MTAPQTVLFELYWHDGCLRTFVVRPGHDVELLALPLSRGRLTDYVRSFQAAFQDGDPYQQESGAWNELSSNWLEGQLGRFIEACDRVVFVPHASFHHLPLHLVRYKDQPLGMQRAVSYCPSATLLVACRHRNRSRREREQSSRILSIGVDFEDEASMVAKTAANASLWLESRGQVDKPHVLAGMSAHDIVHFSCHGVFDLERPMESGLFLDRVGARHLGLSELRGEPNFLAAREIAEARLNAALVVLSACETAQAQNLPGDEILGLTRALFLAGAAAVVVSFWRVPADATKELMRAFYEQLLAGGASAAEAMQASYTRTAAAYRDPAMWGGFAVMGDGLSPWTLH
jgi:CHAT domain-containing protein